jgi:hypothetical protein
MTTDLVITFEGDYFEAYILELSRHDFNDILLNTDGQNFTLWQERLQQHLSISGYTFSKGGAHFNAYVGDDPYLPIIRQFDAQTHDIPASFVRMKDMQPQGKCFLAKEKYISNARHEKVLHEPFNAHALALVQKTCLLPDGKLATTIQPHYDNASFNALEAWLDKEEHYLVSDKGEQYTLHIP